MLLNNEWVNNEIKGETKKFQETNAKEYTTVQNLWDIAKTKREVCSDTGLPKKDRNISNKQPNLTHTRTRGTTTNKIKSQQKEGNNQDQSRIKQHRD